MRIDRLLAITVLMLKKDRVTATELAQRFEVSIRTVYRDFDAMLLAGIPVLAFQGNGGGFGLDDHYKLDKRLLNSDDFQAILSSLAVMNRTFADQGIQQAHDKITSLLPQEMKNYHLSGCEQVAIDIFPWSQNSLVADKIRTIHQAIAKEHLLSFLYHNQKGQPSRRLVEPMTIVFKGYGWYLFAYCRQRQDYRFFKTSRMKEIVVGEESFTRRSGSYEQHLPKKNQSPSLLDIELEFSREVRTFVEESFAEERIVFLKEGGLRVSMSIPDDEWLLSMLLSFGPFVKVLSPLPLAEKLVLAAKKMIELYQT